jgi:hypothetical protein
MLSRSTRAVLDTALRKYRPGRSDLIPVGGIAQLKPALRLMTAYRLMIQEVTGAEVLIDGVLQRDVCLTQRERLRTKRKR